MLTINHNIDIAKIAKKLINTTNTYNKYKIKFFNKIILFIMLDAFKINAKFIVQYKMRHYLIYIIIFFSLLVKSQKINPNGYNKFFYDNGKISSEGTMKDGKPDGYWKNYYKNGKLKIEGNRKNFQLDSLWKFYDEKERLTKTVFYSEGKKNGLICLYDTLNNVISTENYLNDLKEGYTRQFHKNKRLKNLVYFQKGKQEGKAYEFNSDSTIISISNYKNGILQGYERINQLDQDNKKQGIWKEFYQNFEIKKEQRFNDDSLDGYVKEYDKTGNLLSTKKFDNGKRVIKAPEIANVEIYRDVFEDGTLKYEGVYNDGLAIGTHYKYKRKWQCDSSLFLRDDTTKVYINRLVCRFEPVPDSAIEYFDGTVVGRGAVDSIRNRIGWWQEFQNNGDFKAKGFYKEGNRIGDWEFYYSAGKLEQKGKYDKRGKAQGKWFWYYENGKILREENYVNSKREGELIDYSEEGKITVKVNYVDNKKEGPWFYETNDYYEIGNYVNDEQDSLWTSYYMPGKIKRYEGKFFSGEPIGIHKMYQPNGKKLYVGNYLNGMKDGDWKFYDEQEFNYLTITYKSDIEIKWQGEKIRPTYEDGLRTYNIMIDKTHSKTIRK